MTNKKTLMRMHTKKYDYKEQHIKNMERKNKIIKPKVKDKNMSVFDRLKKLRT
jgi:hypothetical protein